MYELFIKYNIETTVVIYCILVVAFISSVIYYHITSSERRNYFKVSTDNYSVLVELVNTILHFYPQCLLGTDKSGSMYYIKLKKNHECYEYITGFVFKVYPEKKIKIEGREKWS